MKTVCMFTGQAAQFKNMGKDVYDNYKLAKDIFNIASKIYGDDVADLIYNRPFEELSKTHNAQITITALNVIYYHLGIQKWFTPDVLMGFSVGELSALYAAGVLSLEDMFHIITVRGKMMHEAAKTQQGAMYAIKNLHYSEIDNIVRDVQKDSVLELTNYNSPNQTVIAGDVDAVNRVIAKTKDLNCECVNINQEGAWHTEHMLMASNAVRKVLENIEIKTPKIPIIFNVTADFEYNPERIRALIAKQIVSPVKWVQSLHKLQALNCDTFYEAGPGKILRSLAMSSFREFKDYRYKIYNINSVDSILSIERELNQTIIDA